MQADAFPAEFEAVVPALDAIRSGYRAIATIRTAEQFTQAGELLKAVKGALRQIEDQRLAITRPQNEAIRATNAQAKAAAAPFEEAERAIKARMVEFSNEQERLRREEQRKAEEAAQRERERIAGEEREAAAKAAELRRQAEEAAAAGRAAEAAKLAARAEKQDDKAEAKAEMQAAVVAPVIQREAPKVAGIATRDVWKFEVTDPSLVPRQYLAIDETKIRRVVQAMKADANIPGVRVYCEKQLAAGVA
jgi:hypothetical protein